MPSAEDQLKYICTVLSKTDMAKPKYGEVASTTGQSSANNAQKKFKAILKTAGFDLVGDKVINLSETDETAASSTTASPSKGGAVTSSTPRKRKAAQTMATSKKAKPVKKTKVETALDEDDENAGGWDYASAEEDTKGAVKKVIKRDRLDRGRSATVEPIASVEIESD